MQCSLSCDFNYFFYPFDLVIVNECMPAETFPVCHIQISISEPGKSLISSTLSYDVCHHEGCVLFTNKRAPNEENAAHFFLYSLLPLNTHNS